RIRSHRKGDHTGEQRRSRDHDGLSLHVATSGSERSLRTARSLRPLAERQGIASSAPSDRVSAGSTSSSPYVTERARWVGRKVPKTRSWSVKRLPKLASVS